MIAVTHVGAEEATKSIAFVHGILGRGSNWRTVARRFVAARPEYAATLIDLRLHGDSREGFAPPDTIEACANDLRALPAPNAIVGHSFGSKVALTWSSEAGSPPVFVIDATPGPRPSREGSESVLGVLDALRATDGKGYAHRRDFVADLGERGVARPVGMWLAMNLREDEGTYRFGIELDRIDALLADYFEVDCWGAFHDGCHLIAGGASPAVSSSDQATAANLGTLHVIEGAGHWVHVDAQDALVEYLAEYVP
ncbi:MAG: alpha/beta hydrolase [Myxococcota bacterium]